MDAENVTRLRRVIGRLARLLNAAPVSENLTPTQASVLGLVAYRGPIGMTELADIEGLNPTMLSRVVAKLVDDGLATRLPNPADQRAVQLEATDAGHEVHLRIIKSRTETVARILDGLSPDVTDALHDALPALEALAEGLRTKKT
ncbi:MarR family winged helix-turn-helix transcriptional regulator [Actinophytocola algeriensis]|uniref:DNA-binding MarR family transcriptional regulator n=1 Tax=Actinophytocola algeriensis TaxID=1768010 RepID=A0A7W7PZN5_9PSEU|nr:MarR family transcriptional regulator [Actinophytocola algeriensis]MBB4904148.1 DNA-binding MarR family transcriptional regulator [Actinophytocola algeriensis]MBE1476995.1 DNA-binding MarR family transcriptional regulator [Actinophytocola algeriensis]